VKKSLGVTMIGTLLAVTLAQPYIARAQVINERQKRQQDRIGEGIQSGELTPKEATKLEAEQTKIQRKKRRFRRNDGKLGPKEKAIITHDQNKASKHIYKEKHD
jgi:hypothetical protein